VFANILFLALDTVFVIRVDEGLELDSDRIELVKTETKYRPTLHHIALALQAGIQSRSAMLLTACTKEALSTAHRRSDASSGENQACRIEN
jgi:hypothetical protein